MNSGRQVIEVLADISFGSVGTHFNTEGGPRSTLYDGDRLAPGHARNSLLGPIDAGSTLLSSAFPNV